MADETFLRFGEMARQAGVEQWQLRAAIRRGFLAEPPRFGRYRMFRPADLPRVKEALQVAGYLK